MLLPNANEMHDLYVANQIPGMLSFREGLQLYQLAKLARVAIVEIGSYKGRSTTFLGRGSKVGNKAPIWAIDHFTGSYEHRSRAEGKINTRDEFDRNMTNVGLIEDIKVINKPSSKAINDKGSPDKIDLLFIDGAHDYNSVLEDVHKWSPLLTKGGIIAFHDTFRAWPDGPRRVASELLKGGDYSDPHITQTLLWMRKTPPLDTISKIRNEAFEALLDFVGPFAARGSMRRKRKRDRKRTLV